MSNQQSFKPGVAAIIIIALGILIFTLLFIFAKRQIMRLAQKFPTDSNHSLIGYDAPRKLCQKIERHLNGIKNIHFEPILCDEHNEFASEANISQYKHIYRMKAMDSIKELEDFIVQSCGRDETKRKHPRQELEQYLYNLRQLDGPLSSCDPKIIDDFAEQYNHARYDPEPDFGPNEYQLFAEHLHRLRLQIVPTKSKISPTKPSTTSAATSSVNKRITKSLTTNLSFKNLTSLSSASSSGNNNNNNSHNNNNNGGNKMIVNTKQNDQTCV